MDNEIELERTRSRIAELDTEVHARELETVRSDLGSDYESSDDDDVTKPDQTKVAARWKSEKEQQAQMLELLRQWNESKSKVDASRSCPETRLLQDTPPRPDSEISRPLLPPSSFRARPSSDPSPSLMPPRLSLMPPSLQPRSSSPPRPSLLTLRPKAPEADVTPPPLFVPSLPPRPPCPKLSQSCPQTDQPCRSSNISPHRDFIERQSGHAAQMDRQTGSSTTTPLENPLQTQTNILSRALLELHLPRPELVAFDGNPKNYRAFITSFQKNIADKTSDEVTKLTYLIQHCRGDAKNVIKDCVLLPPESAYVSAVSRLERRFGQSHLIARSYIDDMVQGPAIKPNDVDGLVKFSDEMANCQIVLSQLQFASDLDASGTLRSIVKRLPYTVQVKWADKASSLLEQGRNPTFADLSTFVEIRARVASSMFGRDLACPREQNKPKTQTKPDSKPTNSMQKVTTLATSLSDSASSGRSPGKRSEESKQQENESKQTEIKKDACPHCEKTGHTVEKCFKFKKLDFKDRHESVRVMGLCFRCLQSGHSARGCKKTCGECKGSHHSLLHDSTRERTQAGAPTGSKEKADTKEHVVASTTVRPKSKASLGTLPLIVKSQGRQKRIYALVDSGSNTTLLRRDLADALGVSGPVSPYKVNTLTGTATHEEQVKVELELCDASEENHVFVTALTVPEINIVVDPPVSAFAKFDYLKDVPVSEVESSNVDLIIGTDCPEMFWTLEERRRERGEPIARKTLLGWIILGSPSSQSAADTTRSCRVQATANTTNVDPLQHQLERMWAADFVDVKFDEPVMSVNDKTALQQIKSTICFEDGKYCVGMPWKHDPTTFLSDNRQMAESRLRLLKRKLDSCPDRVREDYINTVETYIADGHARLVSSEELKEEHQWFLPHHAVFKRSNPEKCRVVFDCAAQFKGVSLNDALYRGPDFLNNLCGVLMRFRKEPVAVVADIKAMFHQCRVPQNDQRFLRFLWWPKGDTKTPPKVHAMAVHLFGATSSPSVVCYCLRNIADTNGHEFSELAVTALRRSFYMDDMLQSVRTAEEAKALIPEMKELLKRGGFELGKFASTDRHVIESVSACDRAKSLKEFDFDDGTLPQESALGLQWNIEGDFFTYSVSLEDKPDTRRGLLSTTASLFDPLGLVAPVLLVPKLIQQELCRRELTWDEPIPAELVEDIRAWRSDTALLSELKIKRVYQDGASKDYKRELHVFCDASESAYGVAVYLKSVGVGHEGVSVTLVVGKARVAPIKSISIPRLELTAATLAAKTSKFVLQELDHSDIEVYFWSDSMTVLHYIRNKATRFKVFVAHRVQQIHDMTSVESWNYIPTDQNPADLASRGLKLTDTERSRLWFDGPEFLHTVSNYSKLFEEPKKEEPPELEVKQSFAVQMETTLNDFILRFSDLHRLLKATVWLTKFVASIRHDEVEKTVSVQELKEAEKCLVRYVQQQEFKEDLRNISQTGSVRKSSKLAALCPTVDTVTDMMCVGGRLSKANDAIVKHPIILPKHHLTQLIIRDVHIRNGHVGSNHVLSVLRRKYHIVKGYSQVRSVVRACISCRRLHGSTMQQKMSDLPKDRVVSDEPAFVRVGVDYFGPFNVKYRRGTAKRYGCLFTCLSTRAVHIEIAHSLTSDSFLMALHRFIARRGRPEKLWSDNGTNFVSANRELEEEIQQLDTTSTRSEMLSLGIEWVFNPPHAPHMGGAWERLIRSVKVLLKNLVGDRLLSDEELLSYMCEVEKILNDRPLTRMGDDPKDDTPLTPNHLLLLRGNTCVSPTDTNPVRRRWKAIQQIANTFYSRFVAEYLPTLQTRIKWTDEKNNLKKNDVVLVSGEGEPRGQWPIGIVEEVETSSDGLVRAATVRCGKTSKRRPIHKLVFLEHHC